MIESGLCTSYKAECLRGVHRDTDTYRLALYTSDAAVGPDTQAYTVAGEVAGSGYVAGGVALAGFNVVTDGRVAILDFEDALWPAATVTARGALVYNATRQNRACAVLDFGRDVASTNGPFAVRMPPAVAGQGLVRWA